MHGLCLIIREVYIYQSGPTTSLQIAVGTVCTHSEEVDKGGSVSCVDLQGANVPFFEQLPITHADGMEKFVIQNVIQNNGFLFIHKFTQFANHPATHPSQPQ